MVQNVIGQNWVLNTDKTLWTHSNCASKSLLCVHGMGAQHWRNGNKKDGTTVQEQLQTKVLLGTSAAMRSIPSVAMEAILGLLPLDVFALGKAIKARARMRRHMKDTWDGTPPWDTAKCWMIN
jgi:hypothetical protein